MVDRRFQDKDGEYALERGSYKADIGVISKILARLRTRRGSIIVLPNFGTRIFEIKKLTSDATRFSEEYTREALADMVASREIRGLKITAVIDRSISNASICLTIIYYDRKGERQTLDYTHRVRR